MFDPKERAIAMGISVVTSESGYLVAVVCGAKSYNVGSLGDDQLRILLDGIELGLLHAAVKWTREEAEAKGAKANEEGLR